MSAVKQLQEEFKTVGTQFQRELTLVREETAKMGHELKESREKIDRYQDKLDILETTLNRPQVKAIDTERIQKTEYGKAFTDYIKKGDDRALRGLDLKATFPNLNETIDPMGGYFVEPEYYNRIIDSLVQWSPIRRYATIVKMNSKEMRFPVQQQAQNQQTGQPLGGMFKTAWGNELAPITQTDTGLVGQKTLVACDLNAYPWLTTDMLEDFAYGSLEGYVRDNIAKSFAYAEGAAFVAGNGIDQPTGLLTDPNIYVNQVKTGNATSIGASGNLLINAYYKLAQYYADQGVWLMARPTIRIVREWVDGMGQYLWTPTFGTTLSQESPGAILGRPYQEVINMPQPDDAGVYASGAIPILFGDVRSAYYIGDRIGMTMLRNPYSNIPYISLWFRSRVAGNVMLPEALVKIECAV